ncbi:MAG TPA: cytochrome D1 domain-containing protein [Geminicoccaceae bacterium]|nr:cytochrome D1 domain-containing protein [Geminicoccus sp.]HMU50653.1 cytochrome D1 domain-containing protein [Geminicoccaceae bacterium]
MTVRWLAMALAVTLPAQAAELRGTGDLGIVVEREAGSVVVVENSTATVLGRIEGLGDLSHASAVFGRDGRFAYLFGRDGGLSKIDLLDQTLAGRIVQAGNAIGGAISDDGQLIAVSNYEPGGVRVFDARSLAPVADIPASWGDGGRLSKTVGLVDAPGRRFVWSLYDAGEIWVADLDDPARPRVERFPGVGHLPYDGNVTPDGRYYLAGLFGEDGVELLDLWNLGAGPRRVLDGYGKGEAPLPVYKMPHFEGWAAAGDELYLPAVGRHELLVVSKATWQETARIPTAGQPVFAVARPDGRQVWVNFAHPDNDRVQVIDVPTRTVVATLQPGRAVLHIEFTPRGDQAWISARDDDAVLVYDSATLTPRAKLSIRKPSGIFFTARANRIGQ